MSNKPNLIFDFDGTLLDAFAGLCDAAKHAFTELNLPCPSHQQIMHYLHSGKQLKTILADESYRSDLDIDIERWIQIFYNRLENPITTPQLFEGVEAGLEQLHQQGFKINIASNRSLKSIESLLKQFNIESLFTCVIGDQAGYELKPSRDMFDYIQGHYPDSKPTDFLMIGDTETDIDFAKACDMPCVIIQYNTTSEVNESSSNDVMKTVNSFQALLEYIYS